MGELWRQIAGTTGVRIVVQLATLATLFLTARTIGPAGRGDVAAILSWVMIISTFAHLSLGQVAQHGMTVRARGVGDGKVAGALLAASALLSGLGWACIAILLLTVPDLVFHNVSIKFLVIGLVGLPAYIWEQYAMSFLVGMQKLDTYNRLQLIGRTLGFAAILTSTIIHGSVESVLLSMTFAQILVATLLFLGVKDTLHEAGISFEFDPKELTQLFHGGLILHMNAVGTVLFTAANVVILNHYAGAEQTGYFQLAYQLVSAMVVIPQAASMVLSGVVTQQGPDHAWHQNLRVLTHTTLGVLLLCVISGLLAPYFIPLFAGHAFAMSVRPFQFMLVGVIGMTFSSVMAPQWIGRGYFLQAAALTLAVGIISVTSSFLLIPAIGMQGAVYAFIGTYLFSIIANGCMAWHCNSQAKRAHGENA